MHLDLPQVARTRAYDELWASTLIFILLRLYIYPAQSYTLRLHPPNTIDAPEPTELPVPPLPTSLLPSAFIDPSDDPRLQLVRPLPSRPRPFQPIRPSPLSYSTSSASLSVQLGALTTKLTAARTEIATSASRLHRATIALQASESARKELETANETLRKHKAEQVKREREIRKRWAADQKEIEELKAEKAARLEEKEERSSLSCQQCSMKETSLLLGVTEEGAEVEEEDELAASAGPASAFETQEKITTLAVSMDSSSLPLSIDISTDRSSCSLLFQSCADTRSPSSGSTLASPSPLPLARPTSSDTIDAEVRDLCLPRGTGELLLTLLSCSSCVQTIQRPPNKSDLPTEGSTSGDTNESIQVRLIFFLIV
jgi:hypothetical protein